MKKGKPEINQYFSDSSREVSFSSLNKSVHVRSSYSTDTFSKLWNVAMNIYDKIDE